MQHLECVKLQKKEIFRGERNRMEKMAQRFLYFFFSFCILFIFLFFFYQAIFSRTVSDKATFEITSPTTLEWSDRRGSYQITSSDSENIQKLYKILAEARNYYFLSFIKFSVSKQSCCSSK